MRVAALKAVLATTVHTLGGYAESQSSGNEWARFEGSNVCRTRAIHRAVFVLAPVDNRE
ncbi:MAG: hypothetical protein LAP13_05165 [Acidobacteriia bacterium]|nr:hypothetical protein [Terriglobia bacterium]